MIKYLCDKCYAQINKDSPYNVTVITEVSSHSMMKTKYDLCSKCAEEVRERVKQIVNGEEEEEE